MRTRVSYVLAVFLGAAGCATYNQAMRPVEATKAVRPIDPAVARLPVECGGTFEWGSGLGRMTGGEVSDDQRRAIEETCHAAAREDWTSFLWWVSFTLVLLVLLGVALWQVRASRRGLSPRVR